MYDAGISATGKYNAATGCRGMPGPLSEQLAVDSNVSLAAVDGRWWDFNSEVLKIDKLECRCCNNGRGSNRSYEIIQSTAPVTPRARDVEAGVIDGIWSTLETEVMPHYGWNLPRWAQPLTSRKPVWLSGRSKAATRAGASTKALKA